MNTSPFGSRTALIGYTGFVGSNLASQYQYTSTFNRSNIANIAGQSFDTVVCAGVQAVKYWANQHPAEDWAGIEALLEPLRTAAAGRFILLSTIDVYASPINVTEADSPPAENHAYGRHRLAVEQFVREHFPKANIVRLPGLFGPGLKKNVIYDLLHHNCLELIQPTSAFQYYHLKHLTDDLIKVTTHEIPLLNLATAPIKTQTILDHFAPGEVVGGKAGGVARYDFRSQYAKHWEGRDGYLYDEPTVLADMAEFFQSERSRLA